MILSTSLRLLSKKKFQFISHCRRYFFTFGWFFCVAGVVVIRYDHLLDLSRFLSPRFFPFFGSLLPNTWLIGLPPTMVPGIILLVIAWLFLFTTSVPTPQVSKASDLCQIQPRYFRELWFPSLIVLFSLLLFFFAEHRDFLSKFYMLPVFGLMIISSVLYLARLDHRRGIRLGLDLSIREGIGLAAGFVALLSVYATGLNSWKFSFIGDEFIFYWHAQKMAHAGLSSIQWLEATGTWDHHPMALDGYQAVFLRVFGDSNFSWRFSMSFLVACLCPFLYFTLRHICRRFSRFPKSCAWFGCGVFFLSEFVIIWAKIGKPHASFLAPVVIAPTFYFAARNRKSRLFYFLTGVACGCGFFFTSIGVLVAVVIVGSWVVIDFGAMILRNRSAIGEKFVEISLITLGFLISAAPFLVQIDHFLNLYGYAISSPEARNNSHLRIAKTLQSFFIFLYYRANGHFLAANVIDPVVAVFIAAGLGMGRLVRWRPWIDAVVALAVISFLVGGMSQYLTPPVTRMHLIMYPLAILASLAFGVLTAKWRFPMVAVFCTVLIIFIGSYSFSKIWFFNPYWRAVPTQMIEMRRIEDSPPDTVFLYVYGEAREGYLLKSMTDSRGLQEKVNFYRENPEGLVDLQEALGKYGGNAEVVFSDSVRDIVRLRNLCDENGARSTPLSLNDRPRPDEQKMGWLGRKMYRVFSLLERDRQG